MKNKIFEKRILILVSKVIKVFLSRQIKHFLKQKDTFNNTLIQILPEELNK